jgi:large subunit ribosomal protein L23
MQKQVIKRPLLTEKATLLNEAGVYTFEVVPGANKIEIAQAVESRFGVTVSSVRTSWIKAKAKVQMTRKGVRRGMKSARKKAIVQLKAGQSIDLFAPMDTKEAGAL